MLLNKHWLTEICEECGSAFSMRMIKKLHEEQTKYQKIEIYDTASYGKVMLIDDFVMLTDADNFIYHEMMTHPILFSHPFPERVLIVGGGDCGSLCEVLKHHMVATVWQVEIDERVTRLSEQYFPKLCESNQDDRVHFYFEDGIEWVKQAESSSIDIIIIDSTDPIGAAKGLYSDKFYQDCLRVLTDGGLLVHQSESPLFHRQSIIRPMRSAMQKSGFYDCRTFYFPLCTYPSGWWSATMSRKNAPISFARANAATKKSFTTMYYNAEIHQACMATPEFLKDH